MCTRIVSGERDTPEVANPSVQRCEGFQGSLLNDYGGADLDGRTPGEVRAGINTWRQRWKKKGKSFDAMPQMNCETKKKRRLCEECCVYKKEKQKQKNREECSKYNICIKQFRIAWDGEGIGV